MNIQERLSQLITSLQIKNINYITKEFKGSCNGTVLNQTITQYKFSKLIYLHLIYATVSYGFFLNC